MVQLKRSYPATDQLEVRSRLPRSGGVSMRQAEATGGFQAGTAFKPATVDDC